MRKTNMNFRLSMLTYVDFKQQQASEVQRLNSRQTYPELEQSSNSSINRPTIQKGLLTLTAQRSACAT